MMEPRASSSPGLAGPLPDDALVELAERLTGSLSDVEVARLLGEEIDRLARPTHWVLLLGDRDEMVVEQLGGRTPPRMLRRRINPTGTAVGRALSGFEAQVSKAPGNESIFCIDTAKDRAEDLVVIPFGGYEVLGCVEMVNVLGGGKTLNDLQQLRRALRLGGVGLRNARRHLRLSGDEGHDEVTGLDDAKQIRAELSRELARSRRSGRPLSMLLLDIDHFKPVNEEHGRLVGTSLLAEVGAILELSIRRIDVASRWRGDTFALLLPETGRDGAILVAKRLQARLRETPFDVGTEQPAWLTVSGAIAVLDGTENDPEALIHEAELRMRTAQAEGSIEALRLVASSEPNPDPGQV